jgi:N-acetylmuramoyl-L-alanine amidase
VVDVANGDGEGVGGVGGFGGFVEIEQAAHHELDLLLGGEAVADDGAFDGERGVLGDGEAAVGGGEHSDAADLAELEGAFGIGGEEDLLDGDDLGLPEVQEGSEFDVDLGEADGGWVLLAELDGAGAEVQETRVAGGVVDLDYTVAGELGAAVDAEDAHGFESNVGRPVQSKRRSDTQQRPAISLTMARHSVAAFAVALMTLPCLAQTAAKEPEAAAVTAPPATVTGSLNRLVVVLDPAHGGLDGGSRIGDATLEKDVTLALAFKLRSLLAARGFAVVMTRATDAATGPNAAGAPLTLDDRAGIANHTRGVACLLLHATGGGHGVHLYSSELGPADGETPALPWLTAQAAWVTQSRNLGNQIGSALTRAGIALVQSSASVRPVDSLTCPAVVVEVAPQDDDPKSVIDGDYQQHIAEAIAGALVFWKDQAQAPVKLTATAPAATGVVSKGAGTQP